MRSTSRGLTIPGICAAALVRLSHLPPGPLGCDGARSDCAVSMIGIWSQGDSRQRNRRLGLILVLAALLYLGAVIGFIIAY